MEFKDVVTDPAQFRGLMGNRRHRVLRKTIAIADRHCRAFIGRSSIRTRSERGGNEPAPVTRRSDGRQASFGENPIQPVSHAGAPIGSDVVVLQTPDPQTSGAKDLVRPAPLERAISW